ncbi:MAG: hypothetical protein H6739_25530 [Alphaproteobacteria bacterium]|nr:hypothetical protein [Alphaproteobacteria bacterium]
MRIIRITTAAAILAGLTGCAQGKAEGVWHFYLTWASSDDACATELTHNFTNLFTPEEEEIENPWTTTSEVTRSDSEFFGSLSESGENLILVFNGTVFEGNKNGDAWVFRADSYTQSSDTDTHETGYTYSITTDQAADYIISGAIKSGVFNGTSSAEWSTVQGWTESDNWSQELADTEIGTQGQIPSYNYLLRDIEGSVVPAYNTFDRADCTSDPCTLTLSSDCSTSYDLVGYQTDLKWDDFEVVAGAGQGSGYQGP